MYSKQEGKTIHVIIFLASFRCQTDINSVFDLLNTSHEDIDLSGTIHLNLEQFYKLDLIPFLYKSKKPPANSSRFSYQF